MIEDRNGAGDYGGTVRLSAFDTYAIVVMQFRR